jgi:hypothetical protein
MVLLERERSSNSQSVNPLFADYYSSYGPHAQSMGLFFAIKCLVSIKFSFDWIEIEDYRMKWWQKGLFIVSLLSCVLLRAENLTIKESKPTRDVSKVYMSTNGITLTPGIRLQSDHFGFDMGISFMLLMPVGLKVSGLYYFNPYTTSKWQHNMSVGVIAGALLRGPYVTYGFQRDIKEDGYWFMNIGGGWGSTEIDVPQNFPIPIVNIGYAF